MDGCGPAPRGSGPSESARVWTDHMIGNLARLRPQITSKRLLLRLRAVGTVIDFCARPHVGPLVAGQRRRPRLVERLLGLPRRHAKGRRRRPVRGRRRSCYVGVESIGSNRKRNRAGPLAGEWYVDAEWTHFDVPVPAPVVNEALDLRPRRSQVRSLRM